jgi:hypothetical protein
MNLGTLSERVMDRFAGMLKIVADNLALDSIPMQIVEDSMSAGESAALLMQFANPAAMTSRIYVNAYYMDDVDMAVVDLDVVIMGTVAGEFYSVDNALKCSLLFSDLTKMDIGKFSTGVLQTFVKIALRTNHSQIVVNIHH